MNVEASTSSASPAGIRRIKQETSQSKLRSGDESLTKRSLPDFLSDLAYDPRG
ncbi:hypothetical protein H0178_25680 [Cytobacillus firmus]|nr:hypothetical protein [Cytobacillus firmus]